MHICLIHTAFRYPLDIATKTTISRRLRRIFVAEWRKAWVNSPHKNEITEEKDRHAAENSLHLCRIFTPQGKRELKLDLFLIVVALRIDTTTGGGPRALRKDWLEAIGQCSHLRIPTLTRGNLRRDRPNGVYPITTNTVTEPQRGKMRERKKGVVHCCDRIKTNQIPRSRVGVTDKSDVLLSS
ncbi:hypothetical protein C8F04DRAFT_1198933 [Mycena alexandri]|uniref:Uncharacterized protein n=1 Tax=Mycena alexandri TaxID=1745969 RepID=A0AAD6S101_9AGAR|nr:hypothetical protein C8F04DRAFT_1198933 [Mycena alexandri]